MPYKVVARAARVDSLSQTAWQRGCIDGSRWINGRANAFGFVCFIVGGAVGGGLLTSSSLWVRLVEGALAGGIAWVIVNMAVYGGSAACAVKRQRNEAREYARELEAHTEAYANWARRREIAEDFRRETLEHVRAIVDGNEKRSPIELDSHWQASIAHIVGQLREHGAADDSQALIEIGVQRGVLDAKEDSYGDDEIARIRNSMVTTCQNVWTTIRSEAAPSAPAPPTVGGSDQ